MATQFFEDVSIGGIKDGSVVINRINTSQAPSAAGHIRINGDSLQWWGATAGAIQTALMVAGTGANHIRPVPLSALDIVSTSTMPVLTRNAAGDWYFERTGLAAETIYISAEVPFKIETALYGAKLTKVLLAYETGTADLTSLDVTATSTVFAFGVNPVVTASHGGAVVDGDYDSNHNTAVKRKKFDVANGEHLLTLTLNTPVFYTTANGVVRAEVAAVLQNTSLFRLRHFAMVYTEALN